MVKSTNLYRCGMVAAVALLGFACSDVDDLSISIADTIQPDDVTSLTILRTGTGSGEWDVEDNDAFNYYFTSYPAGKFTVEVLEGKENDYCRSSESNEVSDGRMHNSVNREMLVKEKSQGEITIAIACHKKIYRFFSADSLVHLQLVVEDASEKVADTVVFTIDRIPSRLSQAGEVKR